MEIGKERLNRFLDEQCLQEWVGLNLLNACNYFKK